MTKSKIKPVDPATFYAAYGEPPKAELNKNDVTTVIPLKTCTFSTHCGSFLLRQGVPFTADGPLQRELRECGVIA